MDRKLDQDTYDLLNDVLEELEPMPYVHTHGLAKRIRARMAEADRAYARRRADKPTPGATRPSDRVIAREGTP